MNNNNNIENIMNKDIADQDAQLETKIEELTTQLCSHRIIQEITDINSLQTFMQHHVYAVWDFMSLLKRLQNDLTCNSLPWRPSPYPKNVVRLINEIVLSEESDFDQNGHPLDHFSLYLKSMEEVCADTNDISNFIGQANKSYPNTAIEKFVKFNLDVAMNGSTLDVANVFFYGREKIIPNLFTPIVETITKNNINAPTLTYYLKRHIELDGDEHAHMADDILKILSSANSDYIRSKSIVLEALQLRIKLWDSALEQIHSH